MTDLGVDPVPAPILGAAGREAFRRHKGARAFDAHGRIADASAAPDGIADDQDLPVALATAFAGPFRIGGAGALSVTGGAFETLTSGSTGLPRRVQRRVRSWTASFAVNAGVFGIGPGARVASMGPLTASLSLYATIEALSLGAEAHLLAAARPDRQADLIRRRQISHLYATPVQLRLVIGAGGAMFPDLRQVIIGGAKLDAELRSACQARAPGAEIREFYGATETSFVTLSDKDTPQGSVGRAYPGVEIDIRKDGISLPDGVAGDIWTRSPYHFSGYADPLDKDAVAQDGWLSIGEIGTLRHGCLFVLGRSSRIVKVADQNVFPEAIETFLHSLAGIARCAVLSRPDPLRGHVLFVVAMGDETQTDRLLRLLRARLGPTRAPKDILWRKDWPILASGKTDLRALLQDAA